MSIHNTDKALPDGFVLEWGKHPYRIKSCLIADGFGFTYEGEALGDGVEVKNVIIREFFLGRCCQRGEDGAEMVCDEEIESTINDTLTRHAQNLMVRYKTSREHQSLLTILDVFEANGTYYHVAENLGGPSLEEIVLTKGPLKAEEARKLFLPIFGAVKQLHLQNVLHTDICPANIKFRNGIPVLTHLYGAKHFNEDGEMTIAIPTLNCREGYAPPEQYLPIETFFPQIDIFALASTIAFTMTGKRLPSSPTLTEQKLVEFFPAGFPTDIRNALIRALSHDMENRPQTLSSFKKALDTNFGAKDEPVIKDKRFKKVAKWMKDKWQAFSNYLPSVHDDDIPLTEEEIEADLPDTDEIEASMNDAYPRLIVIGGLVVFIIIGLIVLILATI